MDLQTFSDFVSRMGWEGFQVGAVDGAMAARIEHQTKEGPVHMLVRVDAEWLRITVAPFLETRGDNSFELARWLLRQNWDMHQAKFAYGENGDVVLMAELPTEGLDFVEFETALRTVLAQSILHRAVLRDALEKAQG